MGTLREVLNEASQIVEQIVAGDFQVGVFVGSKFRNPLAKVGIVVELMTIHFDKQSLRPLNLLNANRHW